MPGNTEKKVGLSGACLECCSGTLKFEASLTYTMKSCLKNKSLKRDGEIAVSKVLPYNHEKPFVILLPT